MATTNPTGIKINGQLIATEATIYALATETNVAFQSVRNVTNSLADRIEEIEDEVVAGLDDRFAAIENDIEDLQDADIVINGRIDTLSTTVSGINTRVGNLETEVTGIHTDVNNINTRIDGVDSAISGINTRVDGIDSRIDGVVASVVTTNGRIDDLENEVATNAVDILTIQGQLNENIVKTLDNDDITRTSDDVTASFRVVNTNLTNTAPDSYDNISFTIPSVGSTYAGVMTPAYMTELRTGIQLAQDRIDAIIANPTGRVVTGSVTNPTFATMTAAFIAGGPSGDDPTPVHGDQFINTVGGNVVWLFTGAGTTTASDTELVDGADMWIRLNVIQIAGTNIVGGVMQHPGAGTGSQVREVIIAPDGSMSVANDLMTATEVEYRIATNLTVFKDNYTDEQIGSPASPDNFPTSLAVSEFVSQYVAENAPSQIDTVTSLTAGTGQNTIFADGALAPNNAAPSTRTILNALNAVIPAATGVAVTWPTITFLAS